MTIADALLALWPEAIKDNCPKLGDMVPNGCLLEANRFFQSVSLLLLVLHYAEHFSGDWTCVVSFFYDYRSMIHLSISSFLGIIAAIYLLTIVATLQLPAFLEQYFYAGIPILDGTNIPRNQ